MSIYIPLLSLFCCLLLAWIISLAQSWTSLLVWQNYIAWIMLWEKFQSRFWKCWHDWFPSIMVDWMPKTPSRSSADLWRLSCQKKPVPLSQLDYLHTMPTVQGGWSTITIDYTVYHFLYHFPNLVFWAGGQLPVLCWILLTSIDEWRR